MSKDIVGRYIPKHTDLLFELRDRAQADDLRNREVAPDVEPFDTSALGGTKVLWNQTGTYCVKAGCYNTITIADRWGICSECRRKGF